MREIRHACVPHAVVWLSLVALTCAALVEGDCQVDGKCCRGALRTGAAGCHVVVVMIVIVMVVMVVVVVPCVLLPRAAT